MMNHMVPDFEAEEDYLIPEFHKKSTMGGGGGEEDIMELLWKNGQVVMQSQNQRSVGSKKPETRGLMADRREIRSSVVEEEEEEEETGPSDLFIQEDEMSAWLHYPIDSNSFEDLLYPPSSSAPLATALPPPPLPTPSVAIPPARPPVPPFRQAEGESGGGGQQQQQPPKYTNFLHFYRPNNKAIRSVGNFPPPAAVLRPPRTEEATTSPRAPTEAPESRASRVSEKAPTTVSVAAAAANTGGGGGAAAAGTSSAGRELETCDLSVTSSPGTGSASMEPSSSQHHQQPLPPPPPPADDDRKRKGRDTDDTECHSEDVEFEYPDAKKQSHGATSTKRSRAAEVHNLSERRRRDRINEKMKALQELIPRCNKSDKASMLDEAIEYLKSLQMQVQMMSMGCSMVPMMFPGVQQYMPSMAMGMGMDMGMNRTMVPYPTILTGSSLPNRAAAVAAAAQLGQRFPVPGLNMSPPVAIPVPAASQAVNMSAPMMSSFPLHNQNQPRPPNFADPFQQYLGLHQTQLPIPQNQGGMPPIATKPSTSKDPTNQTG